jgi:hypothetical protein
MAPSFNAPSLLRDKYPKMYNIIFIIQTLKMLTRAQMSYLACLQLKAMLYIHYNGTSSERM